MTANTSENKKVLVAMSGGADSSVAAALLKMQGFEVVGVFFKLWQNPQAKLSNTGGSCCTVNDEKNAEKIANYLEIPFHIVNLAEEFKHYVIDYVIHETLQMRLPNPCATCNHKFKFNALVDKATKLKCDLVATGHYAKLVKSFETSEVHLFKATDIQKDQSFDLFGLNQEQLSRVLMPLGDLTKSYILKMARNFKLPVIESRDNRGICFVTDGLNKTLVETITQGSIKHTGSVENIEGRILGKHEGIYKYSVGQKPDFKFSLGTIEDPVILYPDLSSSALVVGPSRELNKTGIVLSQCNWIGKQDFLHGIRVNAKFYPLHQGIKGSLTLLNNQSVFLRLDQPIRAVQPGQPIVFYIEDQVIGGGWVEATPEPDYRAQGLTSGTL